MPRNFLWVTLAVTISAACVSAQTIQVDKNNRTIAITAGDTASAEADMAAVTVGFRIYAPDAATAYEKGSALSNAIMDALRKAGIPDKAIESQQQNLTHTDFPEDEKANPADRAQKQFTLSQNWTVHTAADSAARVLHLAIEAGANESGGIDWELSTRDALEGQAAAKALVRARAIAAQMASGLGAHLGALIYASNQAPLTPIRRLLQSSNAEVMMSDQAHPVSPLAIRPQKVEESATVYAVFAIE